MNKPCRYAAFWTSSQGYNVHPVGYGIKAFDLGGHGSVLPLTISNSDSLDLTAYAVRGEDKTTFGDHYQQGTRRWWTQCGRHH